MEIKWLGHSSFMIKSSSGKIIITDPFDDSIGYETYKGNADIVTVSHHHFDHDNIKDIQGNPTILDKVGTYKIEDIIIKGFSSFHDKVKGEKRGENIIFVINIEGYVICHLGDLGHELPDETIDLIGPVDILLIPVGGNFTINGKEAATIAKSINSHIVIPMHYKTPALSFPLQGVESFIMHMKSCEKIPNNSITFNESLKSSNQVKLLKYV